MAFALANFTPAGGSSARGKAPQLHTYQSSADNLATVVGSGYFDEIANLLEAGDIIFFIDVGAAVDIITVAAISGAGVVTIESNDINSA